MRSFRKEELLDDTQFSSRIFDELGFVHRLCPKCKTGFWTLDTERVLCGEPPCEEYTFIGKPKTKKFDWGSMRRSYINFFENLGHTPVGRYPILARWRDDIYYTIATIACFQPWVTSGVAPPPANPLVISQPCIRFNDLDNVGKTGRHFSAFEMMAHHAFNSREKHVYFKDETLEYAYLWFTKGMGVPPEELVFKDSWWEGGGNAGPCHECVVDGLELCTLVHMGYEGPRPDGTYREIPLKVVDTGYGLERAVWLSQGSPTAYDAVMPGVVEYIRGLAGVSRVDKEILAEYSKVAGVLDVEAKNWVELKKKIFGVVSGRTGCDPKEIEDMIKPYEAVYAIADHSRAVCYMLGDGAVPSNAREGYLVRLLIRRLIRFLASLGLDKEGILQKVVKKQFDMVKTLFPEMKDREDEIFDMVDLEERRYRECLVKGYKVVLKTVKKLKELGKRSVPLDELKNLYNTHGILPEEVQKFVGTDMVVNIPENFGALVAMEHATPSTTTEKHQEDLEEKAEKLSHLPKTKVLFYDNPEQKVFSATILHVEKNLLVLDQTLFYPEGGGQPADQGEIEAGDRRAKVVDVQKVGDKIFHITDNPNCEKIFTIKERVKGIIDWDRRKRHCQHHTATHILIGTCRKLFGEHIWQTGSQLSEKRARLDLTHHKNLTREELNKIEKIANQVVQAALPVRSEMMSRTLAEKTYGFRLYQGGAVPGAEIRVLSIKDWETEACGGTHCTNTGEVGLIKILRCDRIQDGVVRLEFTAGEAAIETIQEYWGHLEEVAKLWGVPLDQVPKTAKRFFDEWKKQRGIIKKLEEQLASGGLEEQVERVDGVKLLTGVMPATSVATLFKAAEARISRDPSTVVVLLATQEKRVILAGLAGEKAVSSGVDVGFVVGEAAKHLGGGGGGTRRKAQGGGTKPELVGEAFELVKKLVSKQVSVG